MKRLLFKVFGVIDVHNSSFHWSTAWLSDLESGDFRVTLASTFLHLFEILLKTWFVLPTSSTISFQKQHIIKKIQNELRRLQWAADQFWHLLGPSGDPPFPFVDKNIFQCFFLNKILALAYCPFQRARKIAFAGTEAIKRGPNLEEGAGALSLLLPVIRVDKKIPTKHSKILYSFHHGAESNTRFSCFERK